MRSAAGALTGRKAAGVSRPEGARQGLLDRGSLRPGDGHLGAPADMPTPRSHMTVSAVGGRLCDRRRGSAANRAQRGVPCAARGVRHCDESLGLGCGAADSALRAVEQCHRRTHLRDGRRKQPRTARAEEIVRNLRTVSVVEVYDLASGRWTRGRDLATPRGWFSTSTVNGRVYVVGGRSLASDGGTLTSRFQG